MSTMNPGQQTGNKEEDAIHDTKSEARLEHRTRLIDINPERVKVGGPHGAQVDKVRVASVDGGAVHVADPAQIKDGGDEGADESEVDKGDELRVGGGAVVGK